MLPPLSRSLPRRIAALLSLAILAVACRGDAAKPDEDGAVGGTMVVVQPEPETLFPPQVTGTQAWPIIGSIFDHLAEVGDDLQTSGDAGFTPRLAKSWQWSSDSLSIAFALDPAARWHDGKPVRAEDVRFTYRVYSSDSVDSDQRSALGNIDSVSVRDSLTAVFWFKRRLPHQFFDATYHMYILPSHLLGGLPLAEMGNASFRENPVGTGRFRFARWDKGSRIEMIADTANSRGRAKLDRVLFEFTTDFGAATVKLFSGDADFYEAIRPDNLPQVAASPNLRVVEFPALKYEFVGYNLRARGDSTRPHPVLGDSRVRRALAMAVDRDRLTRNVLDTLGRTALAAAPRVLIPDTAALVPLRFDAAAAAALLDSLGWLADPKDGIRTRNGVRMSIELVAGSSSEARQRASLVLQQQLRAVGVDVKLQTLEGKAVGAKVMSGDYDAAMLGWAMTPGRLGMVQTWRSDGESNHGRYDSPDFDRLLDSAINSTNPRGGTERWTAVLQRLIDDQPGMWLYESVQPIAIHKRIVTRPLRADAWFAGLADWTVDPAQRIDRDRIGLRAAR